MNTHKNATLAGFIACILWSSSGLLVALGGRIPSFQLMSLTYGLGSLLLLVYFLLRGHSLKEYFYRPLHDYLFLLFGIGANTVCFFIAFKMVTPFEANTINYTWPILLILTIGITQRQSPPVSSLVGMALGFAGCVLLMNAKDNGFFGNLEAGHAIAFLGAITWASYSCLARDKTYPGGFVIAIFMVMAVIFGAVHIYAENWVAPRPDEWFVIFLLAVIDISYVLWDYAMRQGDRVLVTSISYFIPLFSTILMTLGGFGAVSPAIGMAAAMIVAGCLIVNIGQIRKLFVK